MRYVEYVDSLYISALIEIKWWQWHQKYSLKWLSKQKEPTSQRNGDYTRIHDHRVKSTLRIHSRIYSASLASPRTKLFRLSHIPATHLAPSLYIYIYMENRVAGTGGNFDLRKFHRAFCSVVDQGGRLATADSSLSRDICRVTWIIVSSRTIIYEAFRFIDSELMERSVIIRGSSTVIFLSWKER